MEVEKRSSKGGFLQLFDWNVKSRKKLFSNKPDLPESSKQGKENFDLAISRLHQMNIHESMHGSNNNEESGTKAPGVVARLMGLDSLPTVDTSDPSFNPFIDSQSFRQNLNPRITNEHHFDDYGMRNKLDGFTKNPVEDRLQRLQNRPIERFQSEVLPPKSAKSVPITHNRMLSPIKSPGFILSKNAAYIMEQASRMIEQSPQSTVRSTVNPRFPSSFESSSIPLRIKDLKERMESAQRNSKFSETSQRSKAYSPVNSTKLPAREKRKCQTEVVVLKQNVAGNLKQKNKLVSPSTPVKNNIQKLEGSTSRNRSSMKQKEDDVKSVQLDKKQRNTPKKMQNRPTASGTREVLTQNNQKQNSASSKDRTNLKPRVPYQNDRKLASTSKKSVEKTSETGNEKRKNFSGKRRPTDGDIILDGSNNNNNNNKLLIKEKERSVKCNITIDGSSNWESVDRKNGMDVVSFTFNSPIKKPVSESELTGQSSTKNRCLKFQDEQIDNFGTPVIDSDALSVLLEQKLKELSSLVETSKSGSEMVGSKDKSVILHGSDVSLVDQMLVKDKPELQGVEVTECDSNSETYENGIKHQNQNSCTSPSLEEHSLSDDSCITSNSTTTLTSNGNKNYMSARNMELLAEEIELQLQDSATSFPTSIFEFISMSKWSSQPEFEYIKELLNYAELTLNNSALDINIFDQLEDQNKNMDPFLKIQRRSLFDCVSMCLENRRARAFNGSSQEWSKWSTMFQKKDLLAEEIQKEIFSWTNMEDLNVDDVVEKDMSTGNGKWLDFESEALEEGVVIENDMLNVLIDELVADFLS